MRKFKDILKILKDVSRGSESLKKIYFLGSTGAGKTSIIKNILGTNRYSFPNVSQSRTTVVPTEYVISKDFSHYKTIIIFKTKQDIKNSIEDIVRDAMLEHDDDLEIIKDRLKERSDEKFKLYSLVEEDFFENIAQEVININIEDDNSIEKIVNKLLNKVIENFNKIIKDYKLFEDENKPHIFEKSDKEEFIKYNQSIFKKDVQNISILCEYIRIEGNIRNDFIEGDFILIDGEGIGHSLKEKRDTLSIRHFDFFSYSDVILLVEKGDDPFISGGQGAIESIVLNGYSDKLKIAFTKIDKIEAKDKTAYIKRRLNNLKSALKDNDDINFDIKLKDIYRFEYLDYKSKVSELTKRELKKFQKDIQNRIIQTRQILEYDFDDFLSVLDTNGFIDFFKKQLDREHWMRIKAFSRRMLQGENEYLYLKPIVWMLNFIMQDINRFLDKIDEPSAEIIYSKDLIKQQVSKSLIGKLENDFINKRHNIWQKAYEEGGKGSHNRRKELIYKYILQEVIPPSDNSKFKLFIQDIKNILLESGVKERKKASSIKIKSVNIKKVYHSRNFEWNLNQKINILIGKNGSGKSTMAKLIYAFLTNNQEILEKYEFPAITMDILKIYDNNEETISIDKPNENIVDIVYIDTLDKKIKRDNVSSLDSEISELIQRLGDYQRKLNIEFEKNTLTLKSKIDEIVNNIQEATEGELLEFKELKTKETKIKEEIFYKINFFKKIVDSFLEETNKELILDNENTPLIIKLNNKLLGYEDLSSGEKQLLIILLNVLLSNKSSIIIMDEPELSLHVNWQLKMIESILQLNPNAQFIIVTHNPIVVLNRYANEISIIQDSIIKNYEHFSKYMDISTILIDIFNINSLVGSDMEKLIKEYSELQSKDKLQEQEKDRIEEIKRILSNTFIGDFLYNRTYFEFLKFMKNKNINIEEVNNDELNQFLQEFEDFFDD